MSKAELGTLPNELLLYIIGYVFENDREQCVHPQSLLDGGKTPCYCKKGIDHLKVVNKSFRSLVRPLIVPQRWRDLEVISYDIPDYIRTLMDKPELGKYVKNIKLDWVDLDNDSYKPICYEDYDEDCPFNCRRGDSPWTDAELTLITNLIAPSNMPEYLKGPRQKLAFFAPPSVKSNSALAHNLALNLVLLLHMVPNLTTIDMGEVHQDHEDGIFYDADFTSFVAMVMKYIPPGVKEVDKLEEISKQTSLHLPVGLKNLRSFKLSYEVDREDYPYDEGYPVNTLSPIFMLPNIRSISTSQVSANRDSKSTIFAPNSSHLTELSFKDGNVDPENLFGLLNAIKELHKFEYENAQPGARDPSHRRKLVIFEPKFMAEKLAKHKDTLEHLSITQNEKDRDIYVYKPMGSLQHFTKLKFLETTSTIFMSGIEFLRDISEYNSNWNPDRSLFDFLPRSIQHFNFKLRPKHVPQALIQLWEVVDNKCLFPQLRKLTISSDELYFPVGVHSSWTLDKDNKNFDHDCFLKHEGTLPLIKSCIAAEVVLYCPEPWIGCTGPLHANSDGRIESLSGLKYCC